MEQLSEVGHLLVVDNESALVSQLEGVLESIATEWQVSSVKSSREALKILDDQKFEAVLTGSNSAGSDQQPLLKVISEKYPDYLRLVLCDPADTDHLVALPGFAHQFLSKAATAEELQRRLHHCLNVHTMMVLGSGTRGSTVGILPSPPETYTRMEEVLNDEKSGVIQIAEVISADVALATKVIKLVNSAYFGVSKQVQSIQDAINLLGVDNVRALTLSEGYYGGYVARPVLDISIGSIHSECVEVGGFARKIAETLGINAQGVTQAFLAGLLHGVGKIIMLVNFPEKLEEAIRISREKKISIHRAEEESFGLNHALVGSHLLTLWKFEFPVVNAIGYYPDPLQSPSRDIGPLTAVHIAKTFQTFGKEKARELLTNSEYLKALKIGPEELDKISSALEFENAAAAS